MGQPYRTVRCPEVSDQRTNAKADDIIVGSKVYPDAEEAMLSGSSYSSYSEGSSYSSYSDRGHGSEERE
jgi:hypothetical protein